MAIDKFRAPKEDHMLTWHNIFMCEDEFPNILILIKALMSMPVSAAVVEQGHSTLGRILVDNRTAK